LTVLRSLTLPARR